MESKGMFFLMKPAVFVGFVSSDPVGLIHAGRNCYQSRCREPGRTSELCEAPHEWSSHAAEQVTMRFSLRCARNIADEFMRHRHISVTCSSTRYIDYATNMPVVAPAEDMDEKKLTIFMDAMRKAQIAYADMLAAGGSREEARAMVPLSSVPTSKWHATLRELRHILTCYGKLRTAMRYSSRIGLRAHELRSLSSRAHRDVDHSDYSTRAGACARV